MEHYNTTDEVAERCRTVPATVRYWYMNGTGPPSIKVGRRRLYPESGLLAWLDAKAEAEQPGQNVSA